MKPKRAMNNRNLKNNETHIERSLDDKGLKSKRKANKQKPDLQSIQVTYLDRCLRMLEKMIFLKISNLCRTANDLKLSNRVNLHSGLFHEIVETLQQSTIVGELLPQQRDLFFLSTTRRQIKQQIFNFKLRITIQNLYKLNCKFLTINLKNQPMSLQC